MIPNPWGLCPIVPKTKRIYLFYMSIGLETRRLRRKGMTFAISGFCNFPANPIRALAPIRKAAYDERKRPFLVRYAIANKEAMGSRAAAKNKTLLDLFQPTRSTKRFKTDSPKATPKSDDVIADPSSSSVLTAQEKSRMEFHKLLAKAKRNLSICSHRVSDSKSKGEGVKLEELLVEETWVEAFPSELQKPYAVNLCKFVESEISGAGGVPIYPPTHLIFNGLNSTPFDRVKAVILGQDPYHGPGQAMGLSFSVPQGVKVPSSLVNIFKELHKDVGCSIPSHGNLEKWAVQGVLLLNAVLTVRNHQANSHAKKGWEQFTDAVIQTISQKKEGVVFLLWGNSAQQKSRLIDESKHHILKAAHPSGLSANRGFFGCRHFSRTNQLLEEMGISPIDWQL